MAPNLALSQRNQIRAIVSHSMMLNGNFFVADDVNVERFSERILSDAQSGQREHTIIEEMERESINGSNKLVDEIA